MNELRILAAEHLALSRRHFLRMGTAGAALALTPWAAVAEEPRNAALEAAIAKLAYLTLPEDFGTVERGNPLPYTHPEEKLREVGMTRETWKLEVVSDPDAPAKIQSPLTKEAGTALDWEGLMKLGEKHAVRFLKVMTCNNGNSPLGMGLWEGVPLRTVVWLAKPVEDVRRVFYYGYHNDEPKQRFQSSLPIGRVLEDPPGEYPVMLCYKLNGEWLSGKRGGPVRMIVPDAYGFKSVKWLQRVVLSNTPFGNDTYANGNNDVDSWMKTFARFISNPSRGMQGQSVPFTGVAQVGISGLKKVQYWVHPADQALPADDPDFQQGDWKDAELLAPPTNWAGGLPEGKLPENVIGFDNGRPPQWPMRYAIAHWAALIGPLPPGKYDIRCRTIDGNGVAQPQPRPFPKSGRSSIQRVPLTISPA